MARAAVFYGPDEPFELADLPQPALAASEILIRVLQCTLCRSDLHSHAGRREVDTPSILGHEVVGRIEAFGPSAGQTDFTGQSAAVGDRVTWSIVVGCGECFFCTHDLPQKCVQLFKYGHEPMSAASNGGGGLAELVLLTPRTAWLKLPDSIPDSVAALANCAAATAAAVLRAAGPVRDQSVLVLGAGVLGTLACAMARAGGARQVMVVDPHPASRDRAKQFGATHAFDSADLALADRVKAVADGVGPDMALELAGNSASAESCLELVRTGGTVAMAGAVATCDPIQVDPESIVRRMLTIRGVHNYHPQDLQAAVAFLAGPGREFPLESLVGEKYPLDRIEDAFERAHASPGLRVAVTP